MISIAPSRSRVWEKLPEFTQFSYFNSAIRFLHGKPFTLKIYDFGLGNGEIVSKQMPYFANCNYNNRFLIFKFN